MDRDRSDILGTAAALKPGKPHSFVGESGVGYKDLFWICALPKPNMK